MRCRAARSAPRASRAAPLCITGGVASRDLPRHGHLECPCRYEHDGQQAEQGRERAVVLAAEDPAGGKEEDVCRDDRRGSSGSEQRAAARAAGSGGCHEHLGILLIRPVRASVEGSKDVASARCRGSSGSSTCSGSRNVRGGHHASFDRRRHSGPQRLGVNRKLPHAPPFADVAPRGDCLRQRLNRRNARALADSVSRCSIDRARCKRRLPGSM